MRPLLQILSDNHAGNSLALRLRRRRFAFFRKMIDDLPRPMRILDVGGTRLYWEQMGFHDEPGISITILNVQNHELARESGQGGRTQFEAQQGDGRSMPHFPDKSFDVVFSNSVIEHVGSKEDQARFMREVDRVGKRFFVQTPNYFFPIEPHFHVPGFQFLPLAIRIWLLQHFRLGWTAKTPDYEAASEIVRGVRLLSAKELLAISPPETNIFRERFCLLAKSITAYAGFS